MLKRLLFIFLLFMANLSLASHIVGGEFELLYVEKNTYRLRLYLYFDAVNGFPTLLDQDVYAHIFRKSDNKLMQIEFLPKITDENVPYYQEWCTYEEVQTTRIVYGATIVLTDEDFSDPDGYYIAWENCCRNFDVTNVETGDAINQGNNDPTATNDFSGQTYYLEFPSITQNGETFINNSPNQFKPLSSYACPGVAYWADFAGVDIDGDSLSYEIISPLDVTPDGEQNVTRPAPYPPVQWKNGFSLNNIMNGSPDLTITTDGLLSVTPQSVGLFVFAVKIHESRNGVKISEMVREFQLFVTDICNPAVAPEVAGKKLTDPNFISQDEMTVTFSEAVQDNERCISIRVTDDDSGSSDEFMTFQAIPLNFDDDVSQILPEDINTVLSNGSSAIFDICFPECPFVDPIVSEFYEIGILALDDTCPLPLIDTLRVKVFIEPPPNTPPALQIGGSNTQFFQHEVTESVGGNFTVSLDGFDADGQELSFLVFPEGFEMSEVGMSFSDPVFTPGNMSVDFSWDYDCTSGFDYSQGKVIPSGPGESKRLFEIMALIEDEDDCDFARADTLHMDLVIRFPDELSPSIFMVGEDPNEEHIQLNGPIDGNFSFDVKALDGAPDNDALNIVAFGEGFDLDEYGIDFTGVQGGQGVEPGSVASFNWNLDCDLFDLIEKDAYTVNFVATDINDCNLSNSDTLKVEFLLEDVVNNAPELELEVLTEGIELEGDEITVDAFTALELNVSSTDIDNDSLYLTLDFVAGSQDISEYEFEDKAGIGTVESTFNFEIGCQHLNNNFQPGNYLFTFLVWDRSCDVPLSEKLSIKVTVTDVISGDNFLPPNAISPNGDGINDYFSMEVFDEATQRDISILPPDKCNGKFEYIEIFNRWGREVFFHKEREFQWAAENTNAGTYYYRIVFSNRDYKGTLTVID